MTPDSRRTDHGFWPSGISAADAAAANVEYDQLQVNEHGVFWRELDPVSGFYGIVKYKQGKTIKITDNSCNVRNSVHGYGGGDWCLWGDVLYFVQDSDQQIYKLPADGAETAIRLTNNPQFKFADLYPDPTFRRLLCITEKCNESGDAIDDLSAVDITSGQIQLLCSGQDFYSSPAISADGTRLVWIAWNHPHMPWYSNQLYVAELDQYGQITKSREIDASWPEPQSFSQPRFTAGGELYFVTDKNNWWNIYRESGNDQIECVLPLNAEFAVAQWQFAQSFWDFAASGSIACSYLKHASGKLGLIDLQGSLNTFSLPFCQFRFIRFFRKTIYAIAYSNDQNPAVIQFNPESRKLKILHRQSTGFSTQDISVARHYRFPTENDQFAYGFYYSPVNSRIKMDNEHKPPLIMFTHGGPTSSTYPVFNTKIQYWTQRGFAVMDVNYRGSTGYGRLYRNSLAGNWGKTDVEDCQAAIGFLAANGLVDPNRVFIRGSSAGGYTALCSLFSSDLYLGGVSLYGISDPLALIDQTHKFESHYLQWLIGDPELEKRRYYRRSPIHQIEKISCPVIFFQGAKDKVVVPEQTEKMVSRLRNAGFEVKFFLFKDESHGFRAVASNKRVLEEELLFYRALL